MALKHDAVTQLIVGQIEAGLTKIHEANTILLADDSDGTTSVREIDKVLKADAEKEVSEFPERVSKAWAEAQAAYITSREKLDAARNIYRTEVLGEEPVSVSEIDKNDLEELKELRKAVMESLSFLKTYATANNKADFVEWAESVEVPQIGRKGTSTVTGAKKPRVYVKFNDTTYDSFTQAAAALSSKEAKVTAGDLAEAWADAGSGDSFTFADVTVNVVPKPKRSEAA